MAQSTVSASEVSGLLGPGTSFEGKLSFTGTLRIGGQFKGDITSRSTLMISPSARVEGRVQAHTVIVEGEFHGDICAESRVVMRVPAVFRGQVQSPNLQVEEGVVFEGQSSHVKVEDGIPSAQARS